MSSSKLKLVVKERECMVLGMEQTGYVYYVPGARHFELSYVKSVRPSIQFSGLSQSVNSPESLAGVRRQVRPPQ